MLIKRTVLILTLCFIPYLSGQTGHTVFAATGVNHTAVKNYQLSPLNYSGNAFPVAFGYIYKSAFGKHYFVLDYVNPVIKSVHGNEGAQLFFSLKYYFESMPLKFIVSSINYHFILGLNESFFPVFNNVSGGENNLLFNRMSLDFGFVLKRLLNEKSTLEFRFIIPAVSYIIRSGYAHTLPGKYLGKENITVFTLLKSGSWDFYKDFWAYELGLKLKYSKNKKWLLIPEYKIDYFSHKSFKGNIKTVFQSFILNLGYEF
jgi:hypothetical protein